MQNQQWSRVQRIFHEALDRPASDRAAFLAERLSGDPSLIEEVSALLEAHIMSGPVGALERGALHEGATLSERYAIEAEAGSGGMATVYRAHDNKHDRTVAIKVLRPGLGPFIGTKRFLQEIRVTANLQHPHILPLHDSGEVDGLPFYVMPFVSGESLRQRLLRDGRLGVDETLELTGAIAGALDYAHRQSVIHRDIKPENILLQEGVPLVADFGIALAIRNAEERRLTAAGLPIGTPNYMSPEQASGEDRVDARTDVYALACVLYECLTGEPPYGGSSLHSVIAKHLSAPIPSAMEMRPDVPQHLDGALRNALAKDPDDRFPSIREFSDALLSVSAQISTSSVDQSVRPRRRSFASVPPTVSDQEIHFCTASDGANIAYATVGEGPPLVKAANWLSHLEYDWKNPMWRHWWAGLARYNRLIRYDERGCGLSDHDAEMSFDAWVSDLEAVVDAAGLDRFALLGVSQGGPIAIAYAVRHPEKVSCLVLHSSYARGRNHRNMSPEKVAETKALKEVIKVGWGRDDPAFRQVFTTLFYPDAPPDALQWFNEMQRVSCTAENALRIIKGFDVIDVRDLAPRVTAPTLVLHSRDEARIPLDEGRLLASLIPGARFVPLATRNHIPLEGEPAWTTFLDTVHAFLREHDASN